MDDEVRNAAQRISTHVINALRALATNDVELVPLATPVISFERLIVDDVNDWLSYASELEKRHGINVFSEAERGALRQIVAPLTTVTDGIYSDTPPAEADFRQSWEMLKLAAAEVVRLNDWGGGVDLRQFRSAPYAGP